MMQTSSSITGLAGLIITSSILIAVPGPSIMLFVGIVMTNGRNHALRSVVGNAIGMAIVAVTLSVGIGPLIMESGLALPVIRMLGAIALLFIGMQYLFFSGKSATSETTRGKRKNKPMVAGVIVGITNPKALIMFGTIVPSFLSTQMTNPVTMLLSYSAVPIALGILIDCIWVFIANKAKNYMASNAANFLMVNRAGGALIVLMAFTLAVEAITGFMRLLQYV